VLCLEGLGDHLSPTMRDSERLYLRMARGDGSGVGSDGTEMQQSKCVQIH
jgi:hypothetical protein